MKQRTLLLVGASGGLGLKMIPVFLKHGFNLALHYKNEMEALEMYASEENLKGRIKLYQADITVETEVKELCASVVSNFGSIDVVVNAAGISANGMSWKMKADDWTSTIATNLTGPFFVIKHVLPSMRNNEFGRIINISSVVAQTGVIGTSAYAASKAGLIGLVKTVAKEVANKNITVNNIALGYFDAGMIDDVPQSMQETIKSTIPKQSFGKPSELAECIVYLSGDQSSYITGQTINLNGGLYS